MCMFRQGLVVVSGEREMESLPLEFRRPTRLTLAAASSAPARLCLGPRRAMYVRVSTRSEGGRGALA